MSEQIERLLAQMTLEEKISLTAGATMFGLAGIKRLGIPAAKVTDGPNGARGSDFAARVASACFPVGIALAATWNPALIEQIGSALGEEAKSKRASVLLGPTVNIHRSPLNGRNFECYAEDPYLSARLVVAYIKGLQSQKVAACVKHFVCNDSEFERNTISSEVGERALREIYLPPFQAAVQEAETWALMSSYNKVNGVYVSENARLLQAILRDEWGFQGLVMSDWFGTYSTAPAANNGLDLEMPGPPKWRGEKLLAAVQNGAVNESVVDEHVRHILALLRKTGALEMPDDLPEEAVDRPAHRALIRATAAESFVLLKNERNILPLRSTRTKSIALIGPSARHPQVMGGGSAKVRAHYVVTPYDGILQRAGDTFELAYAMGCTNHKLLPLIDSTALTPVDGAGQGLSVAYFNNSTLSGDPVLTATTRQSEQFWMGRFAEQVDPHQFSARLQGKFTAAETGMYTFSLVSAGLSRLALNGELLLDNWTNQIHGDAYFGNGSTEVTAPFLMTAGETYALQVEFSAQATQFSALRLGCLPPQPANSIQQAAKLAAQADVALLIVGTTDEWETEGADRQNMHLPGEQNELITQVAAANSNTIVILNTGSPVEMPWLSQVAAVVQVWFPGQEFGNALADVLFGDSNPSGKLPQTFPKRLEDNPAYINYPGENGQVVYGEGIFVGYRYYDKKKIAPLFPFGHGLSYTTFTYSNLVLNATNYSPGDTIQVAVDVTNTGSRAGQEVVQVYVRDVQASLARPEKELKAFAKVALVPGEKKTIHFTLDQAALAYYDPARPGWVAEAGEFRVLIGSSSRDIRLSELFTLTATAVNKVGVYPKTERTT